MRFSIRPPLSHPNSYIFTNIFNFISQKRGNRCREERARREGESREASESERGGRASSGREGSAERKGCEGEKETNKISYGGFGRHALGEGEEGGSEGEETCAQSGVVTV